MRGPTLDALFNTWWSTSIVAIVAMWYLPRVGAYRGRHRLEDATPARTGRLDEFIDVLSMPVHTCALPPGQAAAAYAELGPARFMAAKESMHRRERVLRAARHPSGALAISPWNTPAEADEWADDPRHELIGAAT